MMVTELRGQTETIRIPAVNRDALDYVGRFHEIADGAVPVYHNRIAELGSESVELITTEPELGPASGSAFTGERTAINLIAGNLYELASNLAQAEAQKVAEAYDESRDEDDQV